MHLHPCHYIYIGNAHSSVFSIIFHEQKHHTWLKVLLLLLAYTVCVCISGMMFSDKRLCDALHTHTHTHTHTCTQLIEQQCRGQAWYILLRAHHDLWWEQVGLLNLDLLAPSGWLADWPWVAGWQLAWWRTGFAVVGQSADILTTCISAGRSGRQAGCLFCYFFTDWLTGRLIDKLLICW